MADRPLVGRTLVPWSVIQRHLKAAAPYAHKLLSDATRSEIKPYENALAFGLALKGICLEFGWSPAEVLGILDTIEAVAGAAGGKTDG